MAHSETGIDIHPGRPSANPSSSTTDGVVIGETTEIGRGCKIYQA